MVRLDVASSNVRGGFFPNIGSTGSDAGRYQGAIAEKAVPFPSVARRSQLFFLSVRVTARLGQQIASRALPQLIAIRSTDDESARRRFSTTTISIYLAPTWWCRWRQWQTHQHSFAVEAKRKAGRPRTAGSLKPLTRASAVQAPEEPDQKDDRDRDSDQPKQQTSTHFHLLCNFDCHENVRIPWKFRARGLLGTVRPPRVRREQVNLSSPIID
jgi:hypothetical protein